MAVVLEDDCAISEMLATDPWVFPISFFEESETCSEFFGDYKIWIKYIYGKNGLFCGKTDLKDFNDIAELCCG